MAPLLDFLEKLEAASIPYILSAPTLGYRAIMVSVAVPGERWEIEFLEDGEVQVEVFKSSGHIGHAEKLQELFDWFSD